MKITRETIIDLLETDNERAAAELFEEARKVREKQFGNRIFLYGFVYFTTWCRNNCAFC